MVGLPASGKSTRAKELMEADGNAIRLNKDLIRTMLHFDKFNGKNESLTRDAEIALADYFLNHGKNVIIDDTNLNPKTYNGWKELARPYGHKFEEVKMETSWSECIDRDAKRDGKVGRDVITGMARQYGMYDSKKKDIICDIDGTLCDLTHRLKYVKGVEKKDWKSFFENISKDKPRQEVIDKLWKMSKKCTINLVSGRPDTYRDATVTWLKENDVPYQFLLMRRADDKRDDTEVKRDFLNRYFRKDNIELVIDDRPRVIRMWQEEGLKVDDVGKQIEF